MLGIDIHQRTLTTKRQQICLVGSNPPRPANIMPYFPVSALESSSLRWGATTQLCILIENLLSDIWTYYGESIPNKKGTDTVATTSLSPEEPSRSSRFCPFQCIKNPTRPGTLATDM